MSDIGIDIAFKQPDGATSSLWFKPDAFLGSDFNAEAYVQDLQRYVPLDAMRDELGKHLHTLQNKLVEVVNEDYMNFVNLSTNLVDVEAAVNRLQRPVLGVKAEIEAARGSVAAKAAQLQDGLARRQAAAANRALLELAQDAAHVISKVEKLLQELPAIVPSANSSPSKSITNSSPASSKPSEDVDELESRCRLLDRICSEISRLNFYLAKGEAVPLMKHMEPRAAAASRRLESALDVALRGVLKVQNPAAMGILIHAYTSLGKPQLMEVIIREELIEPLIKAAVENCGPQPAYAALLKGIVSALKTEVGGFLEYVMSPPAGAQAFDFLGGSILPATLATVESKAAGAFSPGLPDAFCANYKEGMLFMVQLESFAVTAEQVRRLRAAPAYQAFFGKWNLPAYFSLRFRDIAGSIEDQLATTGLSPTSSTKAIEGAPQFSYVATAASWAAIQQCVANNVFLVPLADRFLRLALQLVSRYATWLVEGLKTASEAAEQSLEQQQAQNQQGGQTPPVEGQEMQPQVVAPSPSSWAAGASIEQLTTLWQDVSILIESLTTTFVPKFLKLLSLETQEGAQALESAFNESNMQLTSASTTIIESAAALLTERCCVALKQLRGIVATFRMANRSAPTRASHYVLTILAPLQQCLTAADGAGKLPVTTKQELTKEVVLGIAGRYQQLAEDTLSTVRKTEDSLRRLKYRKNATPEQGCEGEAAAPMDTDKLISLQLFLDVEEFGRQLKKLGLAPAELPAFKSLWMAVAPAERVAEIDSL